MTRFLDGLRTVHRKVYGWLFDPTEAYALVICRIGLGTVLFFAYLSRWPLVEVLYGPTGYAGYTYRQRFPENADVGWSFVQRFNLLDSVSVSEPIWILYVLLLISSLCFAAGVRPKLFGTIALVLHVLFVARNPGATWGWATMIKPFMLYTILAATDNQWSVSQWWREIRGTSRGPTEWTCSAWPMRLLQVHIACAFLVLWSRLDEQSWLTGQTLAAALVNRDWGRFDIDWHPYFGWLEIGGVAALVLECGAPIALWIKPIARFWALGLIGMFATLVVTTSVGWWDFTMIFVLSVFLPPEWLERLIRTLTRSNTVTSPLSSSTGNSSSA